MTQVILSQLIGSNLASDGISKGNMPVKRGTSQRCLQINLKDARLRKMQVLDVSRVGACEARRETSLTRRLGLVALLGGTCVRNELHGSRGRESEREMRKSCLDAAQLAARTTGAGLAMRLALAHSLCDRHRRLSR